MVRWSLRCCLFQGCVVQDLERGLPRGDGLDGGVVAGEVELEGNAPGSVVQLSELVGVAPRVRAVLSLAATQWRSTPECGSAHGDLQCVAAVESVRCRDVQAVPSRGKSQFAATAQMGHGEGAAEACLPAHWGRDGSPGFQPDPASDPRGKLGHVAAGGWAQYLTVGEHLGGARDRLSHGVEQVHLQELLTDVSVADLVLHSAAAGGGDGLGHHGQDVGGWEGSAVGVGQGAGVVPVQGGQVEFAACTGGLGGEHRAPLPLVGPDLTLDHPGGLFALGQGDAHLVLPIPDRW